jgi:dinuclear metal center YbgI/SA1388 family protein
LHDRAEVIRVDRVCQILADIAPLALAESWDNVGLLVGDRQRSIRVVMVCLTVTPQVVEEAIAKRVELIVTHHPLPFRPLTKITSDTTVGKMLLALITHGIAVYSAHTAYDSARGGINQLWAEGLGLSGIAPLVLADPTRLHPTGGLNPAGINTPVACQAPAEPIGAGRYGRLPEPLDPASLAQKVASICRCRSWKLVGGKLAGGKLAGGSPPGSANAPISKVAIACGSGGSFLSAAKGRGCQALVTGEASFHDCLEAEASGLALILVGHYASERFGMERLSGRLATEFRRIDGELEVFSSDADVDPLRTVAADDFED